MIQARSASEAHLQWPPDRFYWSVIDASTFRGSRSRRLQQAGYVFENVLPVPLEQVHAIYRSVPPSSAPAPAPAPAPGSSPSTSNGARLLACGIDRNVLSEQVPTTAITLCPDGVPRLFAEDLRAAIDPCELNLLCGEFTPPEVRRWSGRWVMVMGMTFILACAIVAGGFQSRAVRARAALDSVHQECAELLARVLGPEVAAGPNAELSLIAEQRTLQQTRRSIMPEQAIFNSASALAHLLALWPDQHELQVQSLVISDGSISIAGEAPAGRDAQALAQALRALDGWDVLNPRFEARPSGTMKEGSVSFTVQLKPIEASP